MAEIVRWLQRPRPSPSRVYSIVCGDLNVREDNLFSVLVQLVPF